MSPNTDSIGRRAESIALRFGLVFVIALYLVLGVAYNIKVPRWNAPDEPAHYNYVKHLAEGRGLPVLKAEDWDAEYLERLKSAKFPDSLPIDSVRYESWQPPLYYALSAPVYLATDGLGLSRQVFAMRLVSTLFGVLLLLVTHGVVREVFPRWPWLPLLATSFVALVPMYGAINASINNDSLANLLMSTIVLVLIVTANPARRGDDDQGGGLAGWLVSKWHRAPLVLGVLLGLGLVTKMSIGVAVVLIAVGALWIGGRPWRDNWRRVVSWLAVVYVTALAIGGWWFIRNAVTYGNMDLLAKHWHDTVVVGQPRTGVFDWGAAKHLLTVTYQSFWAQFGWMGVPADERTYRMIGVLCGLVGLGLLLFVTRVIWRKEVLSGFQWRALGLMLLNLMLTVAVFVWYNQTFIQAQGRYLFAALVSIAALFGLGLSQLAPNRLAPLLYGLVIAGLVGLNVYCLYRVIGPAFGT